MMVMTDLHVIARSFGQAWSCKLSAASDVSIGALDVPSRRHDDL